MEGVEDSEKMKITEKIEALKRGQANANEFWDDDSVQKGYKYFMAVYESSIVAIIEKSNHKSQI